MPSPSHRRRKTAQGCRGERRPRLETLEDRRLLAVDFELLRDIDASFTQDDSSPGEFVDVGGIAYFSATTQAHGRELWRSDGTAAGTWIVRDIGAERASSNPTHLINVGGVLYFSAVDSYLGRELWKSDGTAAGTVMVRDIFPGPDNGINSVVYTDFANVDGTLFFEGTTDQGSELWKSDGTAAGTVQVKNIEPGPIGAFPRSLTNVNGTLYFRAGHSPQHLWKSDGTEAGTIQISNAVMDHFNSDRGVIAAVGSTVYFSARDPSVTDANGARLWKTDGPPGSAVIVSPAVSFPAQLTNLGGTLLFQGRATDGSTGYEWWRTNGTFAGTTLLKDIKPGSADGGLGESCIIGTSLFFAADAGAGNVALWKTDGTTESTVLIKQIAGPEPTGLTSFGGNLFFSSNGLWKSDGTPVGTNLLHPTFFTAYVHPQLGVVRDKLIYGAALSAGDYELWITDGTAVGTSQVKDINGRAGNADVSAVATHLGATYISAGPGSSRAANLWRTDGTAAGTSPVTLIGSGLGPITEMLSIGSTLYFKAIDYSSSRYRLWSVAGALQEVVTPIEINVPNASNIRDLTNLGGSLVFRTSDERGDVHQLWKLSPAETAPVLVKSELYPFTFGEFKAVSGVLFFGVLLNGADAGSRVTELWKSDGTADGTLKVKELSTGEAVSFPRNFTEFNGKLVFAVQDHAGQQRLWSSDGTPAGTVPLSDLIVGSSFGFNSVHPSFAVVGSELFFRATDGTSGYELWKTDGTTNGTSRVKDIRVGSASSELFQLTNVNGRLYFGADDGVHGYELWTSNGSAAGTFMVRDIRAGLGSSYAGGFVNVGGRLFYTADDGVHGRELWTTDGTAHGTQLYGDVTRDSGSSSPRIVASVGSRLIISANTYEYGVELWAGYLPPAAGDYDANGHVSGSDFLAWQRSLGATSAPAGSAADGSLNGVVDARDLKVWRNAMPQLATPDPALSMGDYDRNGITNGFDFLRWQRTLGSSDATTDGDRDGRVTGWDLELWQTHYGSHIEAAETVAQMALAHSSTADSHTAVTDALFAAGDFTQLFAPAEASVPRGRYRPALRRPAI